MSRAREISRLPVDGASIIPLPISEAYERGTIGWAVAVSVHVEQFGAAGDGVTDDTAAFVAAADHLVTRFNGGIIKITGRYKIGSNIIIPSRVTIDGCSAGRDNTNPSTEGDIGSTLIVPNTATIILRNGSGIRNAMIREAALVFNQTSAQVAANFLGTAITLATNTTGHVLENLFILGFNQAIKSQDTSTVGSTAQNNRTRIFNVLIDCINGVWLHNCYDIPYLNRIHCWPYTTVWSAAEANSAHLKRSGVGIRLSGTNDWTKVTDSFTYGYAVGAQVTDARSVTFVSVSHDHPPGSTDGSKGYFFEGVCAELRVIGGQVAGKEYGAHVYSTNAVARIAATFTSVGLWKTTTQALRIQSGIVQVVGGFIRNDPDTTPNGIGIKNENTGAAEITITGVDFAGLATAIENESSARILRYANCTFRACNVQITNAYMPSLGSAASIVPNGVDVVFNLTGTTNVTSISSPQRYTGRMITFHCVSGLTFATGGNLVLRSGANTPVAAGQTISFISDGTNWRQV